MSTPPTASTIADEPGEVDLRVVVDRDPEQRPDRVLERPRSRRAGSRSGWRSAQLISELIFGPKVSPLPSGTPARSRGIETIETVRPTGSSETTISESVRASVRPGAGVDPDQEDVQPLAVGGRRGVEIERVVEPPKIWPNIACAAVPSVPGHDVGSDRGDEDRHESDRAEDAGPSPDTADP